MQTKAHKLQHGKHSPFGYFGSKHRIAIKIVKHLPPHSAWVEAFCGSSSITFAKPPAPIEIINDINGDVINFFKQLRDNAEKLYQSIALTPYARQEFFEARANGHHRISNLERARRFMILSMMAINGVFGQKKSGFSSSDSYSRNGKEARVNRWYNVPRRLEPIVERLRSIRIENKDARDLIRGYLNRPATLIYLDPPYLGERAAGYDNDANCQKFHTELLQLACRADCMVMISGYDNDLYRAKLRSQDGWMVTQISSHTRTINGKNLKRKELLWKNRACVLAQKKGKPHIKLNEQESRDNKVNPYRGTNGSKLTI